MNSNNKTKIWKIFPMKKSKNYFIETFTSSNFSAFHFAGKSFNFRHPTGVSSYKSTAVKLWTFRDYLHECFPLVSSHHHLCFPRISHWTSKMFHSLFPISHQQQMIQDVEIFILMKFPIFRSSSITT